MAITVSRGGDLPDSAQKADFYTLVDSATVNNAVSTDTAQTISGQKTFSNTQLFTGSGIPYRTIVLTAGGASLPASGGAERTTTDGTNFSFTTLNFDKTVDELAYWTFVVPDSVTGTTANCYVYWTSTGTAGYTTQFKISSLGRNDDEVLDATVGTTATVNDAITASNDLMVTGVATLTHGWTSGDLAIIKLQVDSGGGGGTALDQDAKVLAIKIEWQQSTNTD